MKKNLALLCLLFCGLLACDQKTAENTVNTETGNEISADDFNWLVGNWQGKVEDGDFYESWTKAGDTKFTGTGYMLMNADTVMKEELTLEQVNGNWIYNVSIDNSAPVAFMMKDSVLANSFVFENKKHDFPQQIIYTKQSDESLVAVISGPMEGKTVTQEFKLNRVKP